MVIIMELMAIKMEFKVTAMECMVMVMEFGVNLMGLMEMVIGYLAMEMEFGVKEIPSGAMVMVL